MGCAAAFCFVFLLIGSLIVGSPSSPEVAGLFLPRWLVAGLIAGAIGWSTRSRWPIWLFPMIVFGFGLMLGFVTTIEPMSGRG